MVRVKRGNVARQSRKKVLKRAKGFRGSLHRLFRSSRQAVIRAMSYATAHRRKKRGDFRALWIARINAAVRPHGMSYSNFIFSLNKSGIKINRKMLAELATKHPEIIKKLAEIANTKK